MVTPVADVVAREAAAGAVAAALPWDGSPPAVRGLVASAVVAGILAVLARAVRDS